MIEGWFVAGVGEVECSGVDGVVCFGCGSFQSELRDSVRRHGLGDHGVERVRFAVVRA